jgi:hypothetical protein
VGVDIGSTVYGFSARADGRHVTDLIGPMLAARLGFVWGFQAQEATKGR